VAKRTSLTRFGPAKTGWVGLGRPIFFFFFLIFKKFSNFSNLFIYTYKFFKLDGLTCTLVRQVDGLDGMG